MNRNEYRRAFIMLRAVLPGYGGHVRLERRTLTGSMYFIVSAPQADGALQALLAGQRDGAYYAASLGELTRDRRGQLTLAYTFDPRSIDGRPLEAYAWVVIARTGSPCAVALTGNVEGSRPMDLDALCRAVDARLSPEPPPAGDLPEPGEASPEPVADDVFTAPAAPVPETAPATCAPEDAREDIRIYTHARARRAAEAGQIAPDSAAPVEAAPQTGTQATAPVCEAAPAPDAKPPAPAAPEAPAASTAPEAPAAPEAASDPCPAAEAMPEAPQAAQEAPADETAEEPVDSRPVTAARRLGLDITRPWPGAAEPLRRLFATQLPAEGAPEDGYVYVRAPMPRESGYAESLIGLMAQDGAITGVRYALPGRYAPEPPAGMEGYRWIGDGAEGFWTLDAPV